MGSLKNIQLIKLKCSYLHFYYNYFSEEQELEDHTLNYILVWRVPVRLIERCKDPDWEDGETWSTLWQEEKNKLKEEVLNSHVQLNTPV